LRAAAVVEEVVADEIPDVGNHPWFTGLDKEVIPELLDIAINQHGLLRNDAEQRAETVVAESVLLAVDRREQCIERIDSEVRHGRFQPPCAVMMTS
jgi:hypothetical protein